VNFSPFLSFLNLLQIVAPRWKYIIIIIIIIVIIITKVLNWYEQYSPCTVCVDQNAERLLILENQFCPTGEKILKKNVCMQ
jgi:hypothetical protein